MSCYESARQCPTCAGDLHERPRPDEWLDSDEYKAGRAVAEIKMYQLRLKGATWR
jgi:hypothetical protein